jgi:hypothetical protein
MDPLAEQNEGIGEYMGRREEWNLFTYVEIDIHVSSSSYLVRYCHL